METIVTAEIVEDLPGRQRQWVMLATAFAVIAAAVILQVQSEERVAVRGLPDHPLPHLCVSRSLLGVSCPGCGLTRSFIYLAHGQWRESWHVHRLGWLLAGLVVVQFPYRGLILTRVMRPLSSWAAQWLVLAVVGLLIMNWILTMTGSFL